MSWPFRRRQYDRVSSHTSRARRKTTTTTTPHASMKNSIASHAHRSHPPRLRPVPSVPRVRFAVPMSRSRLGRRRRRRREPPVNSNRRCSIHCRSPAHSHQHHHRRRQVRTITSRRVHLRIASSPRLRPRHHSHRSHRPYRCPPYHRLVHHPIV